MPQTMTTRRRDARRNQFVSRGSTPQKPWWTIAGVLATAALVLALIYSASVAREAPAIGPSAPGAAILSGAVSLEASQFDDGQARFYRYRTASGKEIRFFVIKSSDGVIRAALDTCEVCYRERKGYRQEGNAMVCNNCDKVFPSAAINVSQGGCNPVPLQRTIEGQHVLLTASSLETGVAYF